MPNRTPVQVGVDLGGTWLRIAAVEPGGRVLKKIRCKAVPLTSLPSVLENWVKSQRLSPTGLSVAARGIWLPRERAALTRRLASIVKRPRVLSDIEGAWEGAFKGPRPISERRILLISGTGSIAYGRDASGRASRAGGLGPLLGDEGSAFWIGREWLKRTAKRGFEDPRLRRLRVHGFPPSEVACHAVMVLHRLRQGDPMAKAIRDEAYRHLNELINNVAETLTGTATTVALAGGVFGSAAFRDPFMKQLPTAAGLRGPVRSFLADFDIATAVAHHGE